jgi:hypothetical protein
LDKPEITNFKHQIRDKVLKPAYKFLFLRDYGVFNLLANDYQELDK